MARRKREKTCDVPGCIHPARSRGKCRAHYQRWWREQKGEPPAQPRMADEVAQQPDVDPLDQVFGLCLRLNGATASEALREMRKQYVIETLSGLGVVHREER